MNTSEILELGARPIRSDAPAGDPGRDAPEFEALQVEIRKLEHPDLPTPNWDAAVDAAGSLLARKGKDLLVAVYLCVALHERDGYKGLASGLSLVRDLVSSFWDSMFPEVTRLRGRIAAFEWLGERGAQAVRRHPPMSADAESVKQALARIGEIGELLTTRLDGGADLLYELRRTLEEQAVDEASAPQAGAPTAVATGPSGPALVASGEDLDSAMAEVRRLLRTAGEYLRTTDPTNPLAYRAPRAGAWMAVKSLPPHTGGKTQIPTPQPADIADKLRQQLAAGQNAGVLQETEGRFAAAMFWLDLHRYAAKALEAMGEDYRGAADAICDEVGALLRRFPELVELRFADDTPLADAETRAWIKTRVLPEPGATTATAAAITAEGAPGGEGFEETCAQATALVRQRKLAEALALLEKGATHAERLRDWVAWKLEVARLCLEQGHAETALAQLEGVDERLRRSTIEDWDRGLCVTVLRELFACRQKVLSSIKAPPEEYQKSRELLGRLTRLDVVAAVEMNGRK